MVSRRALFAALLLAGCGRTDPATERAKLESEFEKLLTGATLAGKFTSTGSDRVSEDRYVIEKASKLAGGIWTITAKIGKHDISVPVPVKVVWAGDTPVITLTDLTIPGMGSFTARVLFYRGEYAGTWSSSKGPGGQMFGRVERTAAPSSQPASGGAR